MLPAQAHQASEPQRISSKGPNLGNRCGRRSIALLIDSKSAGLLWIRGIPATRAVAAIIPSKRHRTKRSCRDSTVRCVRRGDVGGFGRRAITSPATTATAPSSGHTRPSPARYAIRALSISSQRSVRARCDRSAYPRIRSTIVTAETCIRWRDRYSANQPCRAGSCVRASQLSALVSKRKGPHAGWTIV